tara:strand:+ start:469 stop:1311 length:843 start_codon:yes stop_codon:yes gene_type:complete
MKFESLRTGMIFEKVLRHTRKAPLPKGASVIEDGLYEIVECGERKINGYVVNDIFLGNLKDKSGVSVDFTTLSNPNEWRYHESAYIEEEKEYVLIYRKSVKFSDRESVLIETLERRVEVEEKEDKKESNKPRVFPLPPKEPEVEQVEGTETSETTSELSSKDQTEYYKYAGATIDDLQMLVDAFMTKEISQAVHAPKTAYSLAVRQNWEQFADMQYPVREVRTHAVRINNSGRADTDAPLSYQRVLFRLMQGLVWYGSPKHKQALTTWLQRKHWNRNNGK